MGWPAVILLYLATLGSMAIVGIVAALTPDLGAALGTGKTEIGLALSVFSLPSALLAVFCGGIVDRFGARRVIVAASATSACASLLALTLPSFGVFVASLAIAGIGFTGISVAVPAMIVSAAPGKLGVRAMALWSTYPPTGFAVGLLLGAPFAGTGTWPPAFVIHAGVMAILAVASLTLPVAASQEPRALTDQLRSFASVFRERDILRLAAAVAIPSGLSYGTSLVSPSYLADVHGASMGDSATVVAAVKGGAMILCGIVTGALLSRNLGARTLFIMLACLGLVSQILIFWPGSGFGWAVAGLFAWLVAFGGMSAAAMTLLPDVIRSPQQSGAASGLIGQAISVLSFLAPSVYFGMQRWSGFALLAGVGLALAMIALPAAFARRVGAAA